MKKYKSDMKIAMFEKTIIFYKRVIGKTKKI